MKRNLYHLSVIILLTSCNSQAPVKQPDSKALYNINIDSIEDSGETMMSSVFKKVKTIILETTDESVIGGVGSVQVIDNYIFVMDSHTPFRLLAFNADGKFIHKIGSAGHGPGEYLSPSDYTIDPQKKEIYILDAHRRVLKYTIDGKYITTISLGNIHSNYIQYHNGKLYIETYDNYILNEYDPATGKRTNRFLENAIYNKGWDVLNSVSRQWGFASKLSASPKYTHLFTDIIFALGKYQPEPAISVYSKDLPTIDDIAKARSQAKELYEINKSLYDKGKVFNFMNYNETQRHIFFSYMHGQKFQSLIIDKQDKSVKKTNLFDDLVLINNGKSFLSSVGNVSSYSSDGLYKIFDIQHQIEGYTIFDAIKNNWLQPDLDKLEEIKALPEDCNPIIFHYTYE
jgi:hypothetical protein